MNRTYTKLIPLLVLLIIPAGVIAQSPASKPGWEEMTSVEDLYALYPEKVNFIFQHLDLDREGLEKVRQAYENGNSIQAGKRLLDYYQTSEIKNRVSVNVPGVSNATVPAADSIVRDIITIQRVSDQIPRLENGHLDWHHTGPENDLEYAWLHNRHSTVSTMLRAWYDTGNPKYARHIDHYIKDWIISSWPYPLVASRTAMWRGLEVRGRARSWMPVFYNLMDTGYLSPATQLLILSSLPEHAHYLRNFHGGGNWLTMEILALATVATAWPEYKKAPEWLEYSIGTMAESMKEQVYPDGVQTELTSHYHRVALSSFDQFLEIKNLADISLPDFYTDTIEDMWNYLAVTMRPDGSGVLNNDSDRTYNRELIKRAAASHNREDWLHIASNGESGTEPVGGPSFVFPWAGQVISRSGYGPDAHWSFFDIGPWGSGHQHNDKLHLSVSAFGRDLLVDGGRFAYRGELANRFGRYARSSFSHNLVLIDGKGQSPGPRIGREPVPETSYKITGEYDFASSSFSDFIDLEGEGHHTRSLFYVRGEFWVVVDHIKTDRPREVETLWHWHPGSSVTEGTNGLVATANPRGNLSIIPAGQTDWNIEFIKGREEPDVQGWYSSEYNVYEPNTVSIHRSRIDSDQAFVWILYPSEGAAPDVKADIVSRDSDAVEVRVTLPDEGQWNIKVPFFNTAEAGMDYTSTGL
ncbi:MAG: alginate lyase family protein [Balneolales bacterium]